MGHNRVLIWNASKGVSIFPSIPILRQAREISAPKCKLSFQRVNFQNQPREGSVGREMKLFRIRTIFDTLVAHSDTVIIDTIHIAIAVTLCLQSLLNIPRVL